MPRIKSEEVKRLNVTNGVTSSPKKTTNSGSTRKVRRWRPGTVALREIRKFQNNPKHNTRLVVPKAAMIRLFREIAQEQSIGGSVRFGKEALRALHTATESFVTEMFQKADKLRGHAKRKTLHPSDVQVMNE